MHANQSVDKRSERASFLLKNETWLLILKTDADEGQEADDKVKGEPGQVDRGVINEVFQGLVHIRDNISRGTCLSKHSPSDINCGGNHVEIEAVGLNQQPKRPISSNLGDVALGVGSAVNEIVGKDHLGEEDGALIEEDRNSGAEAREELLVAISVLDLPFSFFFLIFI